jgi:transposase
MRLAGDDERLPAMAQEALGYIVAQIHDIEIRLKSFEQRILSLAKENEVCKRLMTVQSIGPYIATAIAATVGDPRNFASGRHFAAWLGLTPKQHSTGGKEKLGGISKRGDSYIRRLLIHGARATVARVRSGQMKSAWLSGLLGRRHFNVATVALANKTARVAWAVMSTEQTYRRAA